MKRQLIIFEDDLFLTDAYQLKFSASKVWKATIFNDGEVALNKVKNLKPDVIIMDLLMPKKSGLDIIKELRADPETANIPVIVASNMSQKAVVGEAMDIGANDYFIKSQSTIADIISKAEKYI